MTMLLSESYHVRVWPSLLSTSAVFSAASPVRGGGRQDDKARIVDEALTPGARVLDVVQSNDIRPQRLCGWCRVMWLPRPTGG